MDRYSPTVSVGLPVFNGQKYLVETLESLLTQTYTDFELIVADNASTDQTISIVEKYARHDSRIRILYSDQNHGATWNYNRIIPEARGKFFRWAAADDLVGDMLLEKCVGLLQERPDVVLAFPQTVLIDENGEVIEHYPNRLNLQSPYPHMRLQGLFDGPGLCNPVFGLIRMSALTQTTLIESYVDSDRVLLGQLALLGKFQEVPEPLFFRRMHSQTSVAANLDRSSRLAWFDPRRRSRIQFPSWRRFFVYVRAIARTKMSVIDRRRSYATLFRHYLGHPGWMVMDFVDAVRPQRSSTKVSRRLQQLNAGEHCDVKHPSEAPISNQ